MLCYTQDDTNAEGGMYYKICFCSPTLTIFNYTTIFFFYYSFNFLHLVFILSYNFYVLVINL